MSEPSFTDISVAESAPAASQRQSPVVQIQVGEKVFTTNLDTLTKESAYFRSLMHRRRNNGTVFVDADPDLFAYILRYLRHGIYPVCFSLDSGHDYVTYSGIRLLAQKFGIESLARWITDRQYEFAIECSLSIGQMTAEDTFTSYSSAEHIYCLGKPVGNRIYVFKRMFTAREDVFVKHRDSA